MLSQSFPCLSSLGVQILKYDVLTKASLKWGEEHCWPAEPLFVPMPGAKDEDDGKLPGGEAGLLPSDVTTPQRETSSGSSDTPITQLVESHFEAQVHLSPKLRARESPRPPPLLTAVSSGVPQATHLLQKDSQNTLNTVTLLVTAYYRERCREKRLMGWNPRERHLRGFPESGGSWGRPYSSQRHLWSIASRGSSSGH